MKFVLGIILGFILISSIFTNIIFADQQWYNLEQKWQFSCPDNWQVTKAPNGIVCDGYSRFISIEFTNYPILKDPEFFNEKEALRLAYDASAFSSNGVKVLNKKVDKWFDSITVVLEVELKDDIKMLGKYVFKENGDSYQVYYMGKSFAYNKEFGQKFLNTLKILNDDDIEEIKKRKLIQSQKKWQEGKAARIIAEKIANEELKQYEKNKEARKKLEETKRDKENKIKINNDKLKSVARTNIKQWKEKAKQLDHRLVALIGISEHTKFNIDDLYARFVEAISKYETAIDNLKNISQDKVDKIAKENEPRIKQKYGDVVAFLNNVERTEEMKNRYPTSEDQYEKAYGKKLTLPNENQRTDFDGDYIPDAIDKCPIKPEDFDGHLDNDGCPDKS